MTNKPILCLDFDGVLHSYSSGWKGANVVPDPPVAGACEFVREAIQHFTVHVFSSRSNQPGGREAMQGWLLDHMRKVMGVEDAGYCFAQIEWPTEKPPAMLTIDDRALTFDGTWPDMQSLKGFKPWNKK